MHNFSDLLSHAVSSTLNDISIKHQNICEELQHKADTPLVIGLKTLQMQKAILATGMFSMFDAELQKMLSCENGFKECKKYLSENEENELLKELECYIDAINVLKHGKGRSYNSLSARVQDLPFTIKMPDQNFFFEGDVGEIETLIEVDDKFINDCVKLISKISSVISFNMSKIKG